MGKIKSGVRSPTAHRTLEQARAAVRGPQATTKEKKKRAARNKARRIMERAGQVSKGDGKDVGHVKPLSKGGSTGKSNLQVQSRSKNRGHGMSRQKRPSSR